MLARRGGETESELTVGGLAKEQNSKVELNVIKALNEKSFRVKKLLRRTENRRSDKSHNNFK